MKFRNILLVVLIVTFTIGLSAEKKFTNFKLEDAKGKVYKLNDITDQKITIVDFWRSDCDPCKKGLPHLDELSSEYDSLRVVAISTDNPRSKRKALAFIKSQKFEFLTLYDLDGKVHGKMKYPTVPYTYLLDNQGNILFEFDSSQPGALETLKSELNKYLTPLHHDDENMPED